MKYIYKPIRFYFIVFITTWMFWISAIIFGKNSDMLANILMLLGLLSPAITAVFSIFLSKSRELKKDFKNKFFELCRINPLNMIKAMMIFFGIVVSSIVTSLFFNQKISQFSLSEDFSFSIYGASALFTLLLAAVIEEIGWRGYGEDAIAFYCSWFQESVIFGCIWSLWHLPLFWIEGTYHNSLSLLGSVYVINFMISVIPLGFITTWVYVKNNRSMLSCIIFHLFVNIMQEKIAMTPTTKCIETFFLIVVAVYIVINNKKLFFEKNHIGNIL